MPDQQSGLGRYLTIVTIIGFADIAIVFGSLPFRHVSVDDPAQFVVLATLLILTEQWPLVMQFRDDLDTITLSGVFACALLMRVDLALVIGVQVAAYLLEDFRSGDRPWRKTLFNVAQYAIALTAAHAVMTAIRPGGIGRPMTAADLGAGLAGSVVFFVVNDILAGAALALSQRRSVVRSLLDELAFQASVNGTMVGLAPLVVAAADQSLLLLPPLLLPLVAVYRGASLAIEREHRMSHDPLTELPNRTLFAQRMEAAMEAARREGRSMAVLMMDLDAFKDVNDTLGHAAGDVLLRMVGPRLGGGLEDASLARLGGDEFGVLLPDVADEAEALLQGRLMYGRLEQPFTVDSFTLDLRSSIGLAVFPQHGQSIDELTRHADVAMYRAKARRSGLEMYDGTTDPRNHRRLVLLYELRTAMAAEQLHLVYQPKVSIATGELVGAEALVRWQHPALGLVMPDEFIGLAENSGQIRPMTEHLLNHLLTQISSWMESDLAVPVSLNLSTRSLLDPTFPDTVAAALSRFGVPPSLLILELTETALMADPERALAVLLRLSDMGVALSVDDFGTGYSSLSYLKTLPVSEVKIDKSFVTHLATDPSDRVIVHSTIDLAANLGLKAVAEGVETIEAWQMLASLGCDTAQGYLISRPEPADAMTAMLHRGRSAPLMGKLIDLTGRSEPIIDVTQ